MTESEKKEIAAMVIEHLKTHSVEIGDLPQTNVLDAKDLLELDKGRSVSLDDLRTFIRGTGIYLEILEKGNLETIPTDENVFSALRTLAEITKNNSELKKIFMRKDRTEQTLFLIRLLGGADFGQYINGKKGASISEEGAAEFASAVIRGLLAVGRIQSPNFAQGMFGSGFSLSTSEDGSSSLEVDYLTARRKAVFYSLSVHDVEHVGGELVVSPAAMIIAKVEETENGYKCFFNQKDSDGRTLYNEFKVDDQARCQTFNLGTLEGGPAGNRFWWRLVTEVGEDYIMISKTDAAQASDIPSEGDNIAQLGNRTDVTRQNAQIISAYGDDAPSRKMYQGISSYDLSDKMVWGEYYDKTTGKMKSVAYGSSFIGNKDKSSYMSYSPEEGMKIKGKIIIKGKDGTDKEFTEDMLPENMKVGAENLLRNSGFTGDYKSVEMDAEKDIASDSDLYSPALDFWEGTANVTEDAASASGFSARLGGISQRVLLVPEESHILSFKAKGTDVTYSVNGEVERAMLTDEYTRIEFRFMSLQNSEVIISGDCTVCEVKLERGTVATDWCPHHKDRNEIADEFRKIWNLLGALAGTTEIDGGMLLTSVIRLGHFQDGKMKRVNGAMSGIYNDDNDVALCFGGDIDKAIYTVNLYKDDPTYQPTAEEMKNIANVVITHGGWAILSNVIVRGGIFADFGVFRGEVHANGGVFMNISNPNGYFAIDGDGRLHCIDADIKGILKRAWRDAERVKVSSRVDPVTGQTVDVFGYDCSPARYDKVRISSMHPEDVYLAWGEKAEGRDIMIWNDLDNLIEGGGLPCEVSMKEGQTVYHDGTAYTSANPYTLQPKSITCMTSFGNSWIVTNVINLNKTQA